MATVLMVWTPVLAAPRTGQIRPLTADFSCMARKTDRQFGYRYRYDVALSVRDGHVRRFRLAQRATARDGDEQGCSIGLDDLKQEIGGDAIVLRGAGEDGEKKSGCAIRVTADPGQIRIRIGESAEAGADCRGGDNVVYCSPRAFWADMIIDRKTSACRPLE